MRNAMCAHIFLSFDSQGIYTYICKIYVYTHILFSYVFYDYS